MSETAEKYKAPNNLVPPEDLNHRASLEVSSVVSPGALSQSGQTPLVANAVAASQAAGQIPSSPPQPPVSAFDETDEDFQSRPPGNHPRVRRSQAPRKSLVELGGNFHVRTDMLDLQTTDQTRRRKEELKELFSQYDADGSGKISQAEFEKLLPGLGIGWLKADVMTKISRELDLNGDGEVSFQEFIMFYDTLVSLAQPDESLQAPGLDAVVADDSGDALLAIVKEQRQKIADNDQYMTDKQIATRARIYQLLYELPSVAPDYIYRRTWDVLILAVILYLWIVVSLQVVKGAMPNFTMLLVDAAITAILLADVIVVMHTAVQVGRQSQLVVERKAIIRHYVKSGDIFIDVLSSVPFDILIGYLSGSMLAWRVLRALRLLKVFKFSKLFLMTDRGTMDSSFVRFYFWTTALLRQGFIIFATLHLLTLLRMVVNMNADQNGQCEDFGKDRCAQSIPGEYAYAFFWVWALLTTQGMAALEDKLTYGYASIVALMALVLQGHVVANMSALVLKSNVDVQNQDAMRATLAIMSHYNVPVRLQQEVLSYQYHSLMQNAAASLAHTLERLPAQMQREVGLYVKVELVTGVPMFEGISTEARLAVANCLEQTYAEPEDFIIKYGETGAEMFFMMHGFADVIIPITIVDESNGEQAVITEGKVVATIKRGDFFGEVALLQPDQTRTASIQALTYCDLFCLHAHDFSQLYDQFTELNHRVQQEARARGLIKDDVGTIVNTSSVIQTTPPPSRPTSLFGVDALPLGMRAQLIHDDKGPRTRRSLTSPSPPITPRKASNMWRRISHACSGGENNNHVETSPQQQKPLQKKDSVPEKDGAVPSRSVVEHAHIRQHLSTGELAGVLAGVVAIVMSWASQGGGKGGISMAEEDLMPDVSPVLDVLEKRIQVQINRQEDIARKQMRDDVRGLGIRMDEIERSIRETFERVVKKEDIVTSPNIPGGPAGGLGVGLAAGGVRRASRAPPRLF
eukprot:Hpha_TRINITY_DN12794_c0_g3::TRINITY_DN12794_c0_g3_i1::g.114450::m.114450